MIRRIKGVEAVVLSTLLSLSSVHPQGLSEGMDQGWLKSLISIEVAKDTGSATSIGSGFLVRTADSHTVLVTAKHVVMKGEDSLRQDLAYRLNDTNGTSYLLTDVEMRKIAGEWFFSPSHDVALRLIGFREGTDIIVIPTDRLLRKDTLKPGAPILIPGFPLGLRSKEHADPIVRAGVVARIDPDVIIVDAMCFPGNSGSPVVYFPTVKLGAGLGSPFINEERVIGVVSQAISFRQEAVSKDTGRTRVDFEDNAGLCTVVPADYILDLLNSEGFKKLDSSLK